MDDPFIREHIEGKVCFFLNFLLTQDALFRPKTTPKIVGKGC